MSLEAMFNGGDIQAMLRQLGDDQLHMFVTPAKADEFGLEDGEILRFEHNDRPVIVHVTAEIPSDQSIIAYRDLREGME